MPLKIGAKLGPYEIEAPLGAGGMGEVWRARDTRLDRSVAIKVLPEAFAKEEALRERFDREAHVISSLSHPHICALHDVGREDGTDFIVLELLEGETLAERLDRGPLPVSEVLARGIEIASALDAAHRRGVTHRDLKPGNVFLTPSGAKLLDFGLAKPEAEPKPLAVSGMATVARPLTEAGTVVGTVHYMAPEQLQGRDVDSRADIFALGAVLFEMTSGQRAFPGDDRASVTAAVLGSDPAPLSRTLPTASPALDRVIATCLAKDPNGRWQSAHDVAKALEWVRDGLSLSGTAVAAPRRPGTREIVAWTLAGAGIVAAVVLGIRPTTVGSNRVLHLGLTEASVFFDTYGGIGVSPDGDAIAYLSERDGAPTLRLRHLDSPEPIEVADSQGAQQPFFSPDGRWLGFVAGRELRVSPVSGGTPKRLARASVSRGADWGDDGSIVFAPFYYGEIHRTTVDGGDSVAITTLDRSAGERNHRWPQMLPGSRAILFTVGFGGSFDPAHVVAQRLDTGERTLLVEGGTDGRFLPTGHLAYLRGNDVYAIRFDPEQLKVDGDPVRVLEGVANNLAGSGEYAFSDNGLLAYLPVGATVEEGGTNSLIDRNGNPMPTALPASTLEGLSRSQLSRDGRHIVAGTGLDEIWAHDIARGTSMKLSAGAARATFPAWSHDGKRVAWASEAYGPWLPVWRSADGSDAEMPMIDQTDWPVVPLEFAPGDDRLLVRRIHPKTAADLYLLEIDSGELEPIVTGEAHEDDASFSPDGNWLAYVSDEAGRREIYVVSLGGPPGRWQVSVGGGARPSWTTQDEILFLGSGDIFRVSVDTDAGFSASAPELLVRGPFRNFDASADGRRLLVETALEHRQTNQLRVVVNWFDDVRRRMEEATR